MRSNDAAEHRLRRKTPQSPGSLRILDAATQQFARDGYGSASLRKIASAARVDPALINHLYGGKEWLWRACVDQVAGKVIAHLKSSDASTCCNLNQVGEHLVDLVCDEPLIAQFILAEISRQDQRFHYVHEKLICPILDILYASHGARTGDALADEIQLLALSGAIATTVAAKSFLARTQPTPVDDHDFRRKLKASVALLTPIDSAKN